MKINSINSAMNYGAVNNSKKQNAQQAPAIQYGSDSVSFSGAKMAMGKRVGLFLAAALVSFGIGAGGKAVYNNQQNKAAIIQQQKDLEQQRLDEIVQKQIEHNEAAQSAKNDENGNLQDMYALEDTIMYKDADEASVNYNLISLLNAAVGETETKPHNDVTKDELELLKYAISQYGEYASDKGKAAAQEFGTHLDELTALTTALRDEALATEYSKVEQAQTETDDAKANYGEDSPQYKSAQQRLENETASFKGFEAYILTAQDNRPISFEAITLDESGKGKYERIKTEKKD